MVGDGGRNRKVKTHTRFHFTRHGYRVIGEITRQIFHADGRSGGSVRKRAAMVIDISAKILQARLAGADARCGQKGRPW